MINRNLTICGIKKQKSNIHLSNTFYSTSIVDNNGNLFTWGGNANYQTDPTAINVANKINVTEPILTGVKKCIIASTHTITLMQNGDIKTWGSNQYLASNPYTTDTTTIYKDINNVLIENVKDIGANGYANFIINQNNELIGFGKNAYNLIDPSRPIDELLTDLSVVITDNVSQIACGANHVLVLKTNGDLYGWGQNTSSQVNGLNTTSPLPITFIKSNIVKINCGLSHSAAIDKDGNLFVWGSNHLRCSDPNQSTSVKVLLTETPLLTNIRDVFCGSSITRVIDNDNNLYSWGSNSNGTADPSVTLTSEYTNINKIQYTDVEIVCEGYYSNTTLFATINGELHAHGYNWCGQANNKDTINPYINRDAILQYLK